MGTLKPHSKGQQEAVVVASALVYNTCMLKAILQLLAIVYIGDRHLSKVNMAAALMLYRII